MNVVSFQHYKNKRDMEKIEREVASLALSHTLGTASQLKTAFGRWLLVAKQG